MTVGGGLAVWDNLSTHLSCENAKVNDNVTALAQQVSAKNKQQYIAVPCLSVIWVLRHANPSRSTSTLVLA